MLIERVSEGSSSMTGGEIAGLIAAIAFAVLVVFIIRVLLQLSKTLEKVDQTVAEANTTIEVVTKDVDLLSRQVEGLLGRTTAKATVAGKVGGTALKFFKNKKHTEKTGGI